MKHMPEILKILEGALKSNAQMSVNHANMLADKLEEEGGRQYAKLIREKLSRAPKQLFSTAGALNQLPVDTESRFPLADETKPTSDLVSVILDRKTSGEVDKFISYVENTDKLIDAGVGVTPTFLIYGPPGCGKTVLANHIAAKLNLPLLTARCDTLISSFLGATSKNIRALFDHTNSRPCVLFLDEFDALAKARDDKQELGELKRVVVGLLQNIDALSKGTVLLAATNHPQLLDPAVWRRFSYRVEMLAPDGDQRRLLFEKVLGRYFPSKSFDVIVDLSLGLTGSDIEQISLDVVRNAVLDGREEVTAAELAMRVIRALPGDKPVDVEDEIKHLRSLAPQLFDYRTLHSLYGLSMRRIAQIFKK